MESNTMNPDQTAPIGSSLIWVHVVCNIGYKITSADEIADDSHCEWQQQGYYRISYILCILAVLYVTS